MQHLRLLNSTVVIGALVVGAIVLGVTALLGAYHGLPTRARTVRAVLVFLLAAGSALTLGVTLMPAGVASPIRYVSFDVVGDLSQQLADFPSPTAITQVLINLLLLSWLALVLPLVSDRMGVLRTTAVCLASSVAIETLQFALVGSGRAATLSDVVLNTLGAAVVARLSVQFLRPRVRRWVDPGV